MAGCFLVAVSNEAGILFLGGSSGAYVVLDPETRTAHLYTFDSGAAGPSINFAGIPITGGGSRLPGGPRDFAGWSLGVSGFAAAGPKGMAADVSTNLQNGFLAAGPAVGVGASLQATGTRTTYEGSFSFGP